jgi:hypothetical protein
VTLRVVTVGVYDFDVESFLHRLRQADVRLLLDVRQRRGVRGPEYACANSLRLQADDRQGVGKRSRHRSLIAQRLAERHHVRVEHLRPS